MTTSHNVGRNDPCPCGSGRKFKYCCQGKTASSPSAGRSPLSYVVVAAVSVGVALVLGKTLFTPAPAKPTAKTVGGSSAATPAQWPLPSAASAGLTPQPPGPVPPGKVWSPEHGHWHDIAPGGGQASSMSVNPATPGASPLGLTPQPPGPAPEGKVWSPEHGHWHDIATGAAPASGVNVNPTTSNPLQVGLTAQPPGPVPEGKVWSPEHGHWHDAPAVVAPASSGGEILKVLQASPFGPTP